MDYVKTFSLGDRGVQAGYVNGNKDGFVWYVEILHIRSTVEMLLSTVVMTLSVSSNHV